jgi:alkaline phosphatase D
LNRRTAIAGIGAATLVAGLSRRDASRGDVSSGGYPFTLGVASGDPGPDSVVLWTRLAPDPLAPNGGMPPAPVSVAWSVYADEACTKVVVEGKTTALADEAHSVHVVAERLEAGRCYWYRFRLGDVPSPVGRTRTLPAAGQVLPRFRLAVAGCQRIEHGFYTAWRDIAGEDVDLVYCYGDYIYEFHLPEDTIPARVGKTLSKRQCRRLRNLGDYRVRHALYKLDPDLAAAHAMHPFVIAMDDHDVINNWAGDGSPRISGPRFLALRAAAFQALYEHCPLRPEAKPNGSAIEINRSFAIGDLIKLIVVDSRQFRSPQACGGPGVKVCPEAGDEGRTMLGPAQESWLEHQFAEARSTWTVLGNQVVMMQLLHGDNEPRTINTDKWDGYSAARRRLLEAAAAAGANLVVLTGDAHRGIAGNLALDFADPSAKLVGVEFVATSISSDRDGEPEVELREMFLRNNPHLKFYDTHRGYTLCTFTGERCVAEYRALDFVSRPGSSIRPAAMFEIRAGEPGLQP